VRRKLPPWRNTTGGALVPERARRCPVSRQQVEVCFATLKGPFGDGLHPGQDAHRTGDQDLKAKVWEFVRSLILDPEHLLDDIERKIEEERNTVRGDPEREAATWLDHLATAERKRSAFQDMAAESLLTLDELRGKLANLDDLRLTAERELRLIEDRKDALWQLE
jgi:hypothetical protein